MMKASDLGYFAGGVLIGFGVAYAALEDRFGTKYAEMANANARAYEIARGLPPVLGFEPVDEITYDEARVAYQDASIREETEVRLLDTPGETRVYVEEKEPNPYHAALAAVETTSETFVAGGVNDYGISYIEEEEFMDEDGRAKCRVDLLMDDVNPIFLLDGLPMDNWVDALGESILVDFYKHCPPGTEPILYVRNHRTDEDYEVVRVEA